MVLNNLKEIREKKHFTMEDMGKSLGISKVAYWKIEHEETKLSYENAVKIANVLDSSLNSLFSFVKLTNKEQK